MNKLALIPILLFAPACAGVLPESLVSLQQTTLPILTVVADIADAFGLDPKELPAECEIEPDGDGHILILCDVDVNNKPGAKK